MTRAPAASTRRGRPVDPDKDRAILEAARAVLLKSGPRAMTMDAVAATAGVSKATLYSRYARRTELLLAVVAGDAAFVSRALGDEAQSLQALRAQLCAFVADLTAFLCGSHHRRMMQALSEEPQSRADLRHIFRGGPQRTLDALAHFLRDADERGLLRCPAPAESAELLLGMALGIDLVRALYGAPLSRNQAAVRRRHVAQVVDGFVQLHQPLA